jgi:MEDS: MEthanogen/methylotroph, DcmR Sensory domain
VSPVDKLTRPHALDAPARGRHLAQLYTRDEGLVRVVGDFVMAGLERGEGIVLIATAAHRAAIARHVEDHGFTPGVLARGRQLTLLDARETLEALRVGAVPDRARFETVIGGAIEACQRAGFERLRAFVEMVELLRRDKDLEAALHLEGLWNDLVAGRGLTLLCGHRIDAFDPQAYQGLLQRVSAVHSHLAPLEDSASLEHAVECAYLDVFGPGRDAAMLRRLFLANYPRPSGMPDAQAAILAAHEFVPEAAATLLNRIRHHYHLARTAA